VRWFILTVAVLMSLTLASSAQADTSYPRIANIYFPDLSTADLGSLARWDVLILPKRAGETAQTEMATLRSLNPDILLIAHAPVGYHGDWTTPPINGDLVAAINANDWWLRDTAGARIIQESGGDAILNETVWCPQSPEGDRLCDWLGEYIAMRLAADDTWDGVFLDSCYDEIAWINQWNPLPVDADGDGIADDPDELNAAWRAGMEILTLRLRELVPDDFIVTTNGNNTLYAQCNGSTREGFPHMHGDWLTNMTHPEWGYQAICSKYAGPVLSTVNTMWDGPIEGGEVVRDEAFERKFAFTFASTLVYGDGYFSFDGGEGLPEHSQDWWHDWYDVDLGEPRGRSEEVTKSIEWVDDSEMVRRRRFERGAVVVNPTTVTQTVGLGGVYAPLAAHNGSFYPYGAMVTEIEVERQSGALVVGTGQLPLMPSGLEFTRGEGGVVTLSWSPVSSAVRYSVYRSHRPEGTLNPCYLEAVAAGATFMDTLAIWETAFYRVAPIDPLGCEGPPSEIVGVRPPRGVGCHEAEHETEDEHMTSGPPGPRNEVPGRADGTGTEEARDETRTSDEYPWSCTVDVDGAVELRGDGGAGGADAETGPVRPVSVSPNPALCSTRIALEVDSGSPPGDDPLVSIYDIRGRLVHRSRADTWTGESRCSDWNLRDMGGARVAAGCYFVVIESRGAALHGKVVVLPDR